MTGPVLSAEALATFREREPSFYYADLLAPPGLRPLAQTLHAFHGEIESIVARANDPMIGQIRLQWWRDVIAGDRSSEARDHPIAGALLHYINAGRLDRNRLDAKLAAHVFDLYNDPMPDWTSFEGWAGETRSVLFQQLATASGVVTSGATADLCGHAGIVIAIRDVLGSVARHRAKQQQFIPLECLEKQDLDSPSWFAVPDERHAAVLASVLDRANDQLAAVRKAAKGVDADTSYLTRPLAAAAQTLSRWEQRPRDLLDGVPRPSRLASMWALYRGKY